MKLEARIFMARSRSTLVSTKIDQTNNRLEHRFTSVGTNCADPITLQRSLRSVFNRNYCVRASLLKGLSENRDSLGSIQLDNFICNDCVKTRVQLLRFAASRDESRRMSYFNLGNLVAVGAQQ